QELYGAQILLGEQVDLPAPGERLGVRSVMTLKNMSETPVRTNAEIYYTQDGVVGVTSLAIGAVPAGAVDLVDFDRLRRSGRIPRSVSNVSVVVRHSGQPGALMGRIFGIGSDPTYAFYSRMESISGRARSEVHWTLEN